jgi:hypothetical protein
VTNHCLHGLRTQGSPGRLRDDPPYREREAERDTFNSDDFIFGRQGGADTVVDLKKEGGSLAVWLLALNEIAEGVSCLAGQNDPAYLCAKINLTLRRLFKMTADGHRA